MATITRKDVIDILAVRTKIKRSDVKMVVQTMLDVISEQLADENRLEFRDFGVFDVRDRQPRVAKNPKTLEPVSVPSRRSVRFRPGRKLLDAVQPGDRPPDQQDPPVVHTRPSAPDHSPRSGAAAEHRPDGPAAYHRAP